MAHFDLTDLTRTVANFNPNGELFQNTQTGRTMPAGYISFEECRHSYMWRPWGFTDDDPVPAPGVQMMCAECIQAAIDRYKAQSGRA